jgi:hypothetical protein
MTVFSWVAVAAMVPAQVIVRLGCTLVRTDLDFVPGIIVQIARKNEGKVHDRSLPWCLTPSSCLDIGVAAVARRRKTGWVRFIALS